MRTWSTSSVILHNSHWSPEAISVFHEANAIEAETGPMTLNSTLVRTFVIAVSLVVSHGLASGAEPGDVLYSTSFEDETVAPFGELQDGAVGIRATGTASITSKFARQGKQCLHLLGDEDSSITWTIPREMQSVRGISFHAERWTSKAPFTFSVDVQQAGEWRQVARLDDVTVVGARFLSHIQLPIPGDEKTEAIRFQVTAAPNSGLLIDDLSFHASAPKRPTSIPTGVMPTEPLELVSSQPLFISGTQDTHTFRIRDIVESCVLVS